MNRDSLSEFKKSVFKTNFDQIQLILSHFPKKNTIPYHFIYIIFKLHKAIQSAVQKALHLKTKQ